MKDLNYLPKKMEIKYFKSMETLSYWYTYKRDINYTLTESLDTYYSA